MENIETDTEATQEPRTPRTVTVKIDGKERTIPWAFKDHRTEGKAAKFHQIEYPGTSRKD